MPIHFPPVAATRRTWLVYAALVAVLAALCFASAADLLLDTHDDDTFRDHERIARSPIPRSLPSGYSASIGLGGRVPIPR